MIYWLESWNQIKGLLEEKIREGLSFDEALVEIKFNNERLYAEFSTNVNRNADGFLKYTFGISTRR